MRILVATTDYPGFLSAFYSRNPGLENAPYAEQMAVRKREPFNIAQYYAKCFADMGHVATCIFANNVHLQMAWARERGMCIGTLAPPPVEDSEVVAWLKRSLRPYKQYLGPIARKMSLVGPLSTLESNIFLAQVNDFAPDIILNQEMQAIDSGIISALRRPKRIIVGQIGVDPPPGLNPKVYNFAISHIPWVVDFFNRNGLKADLQHLAFAPEILNQIGLQPERDVDVSFVGGLGAAHSSRVELLEAVARRFKLALWTPSLKGLSAKSPLHACRRGEVYGAEMFHILQRSRVTLNSHIDVARGSAGNMRLYEATGVGAFLLTDNLDNLGELFEVGREVGAYNSIEDCLGKIQFYLDNPEIREAVSLAGQARTSLNHTVKDRCIKLLRLIEGQVG